MTREDELIAHGHTCAVWNHDACDCERPQRYLRRLSSASRVRTLASQETKG